MIRLYHASTDSNLTELSPEFTSLNAVYMSPNPEFALLHGKYLYYADLILDPKIEENLRNSDLKYKNAEFIDEHDLIEIVFYETIEVKKL